MLLQHAHRTPAAASLLGRMEAALQLLADLLGSIRVQPNLVLPMLRVACQTLTTHGTDLLQLSAVGMFTLSLLYMPYDGTRL